MSTNMRVGSRLRENIEWIMINFIENPKKGGIPANDKKFKKIKKEIEGGMLEKWICLIKLMLEKVKEKIIVIEIRE